MTRRQISDAEKQSVLASHTKDGVVRCFIDDAPLSDTSDIEFHHVKAFSLRGPTDLGNIAPVCKEHHKRVGLLSLEQFRDRLELEKFFVGSTGKRLDDVLLYKAGEFGSKVRFELSGETIKLYFTNSTLNVPSFQCPATGKRYFYASFPIGYIKNDGDLQPRLLEPDRMWELYLHLLRHTQLAPAVCRLVGDQILLFDGQHKTAAQVWLGRKAVDCKVYIEPDALDLKETNLTAHYNLRQMPFYTSTLMQKYADIFQELWTEYAQKPGIKSEAAFIIFLATLKGKTRAEAIRMLRLALQQNVIDHPDNQMAEYVSEKNRARKNPLSISIMQKTFFLEFLKAPPIDVEFEGPQDHRDDEKLNLVKLMNLLTEHTLTDRWRPDVNNSDHKTAARVYAAGALRAWVPLLHGVVAQILHLFDEDERNQVIFRKIDEKDFQVIGDRIKRLFEHNIWRDPDPDVDANLRVNNAEHVKRFLKDKGLTSGWVLGESS